MQIITDADPLFQEFLEKWKDSLQLGTYWKNGKAQHVAASNGFLLIANAKEPNKLAFKPARNQDEAIVMAKQVLSREEKRGNVVEVDHN